MQAVRCRLERFGLKRWRGHASSRTCWAIAKRKVKSLEREEDAVLHGGASRAAAASNGTAMQVVPRRTQCGVG
jgi:hypothetical protein